MAEAIEVTGKDVAEALQHAMQELGCGKDDIEYVVLQKPSHGFLGLFGAKKARLRVMKKAAGKPAEKAPEAHKAPQTPEAEQPAKVQTAPQEVKPENAATPAADEKEAQEPVAELSDAEQADRAEQFLRDVFQAMQIPVQLVRSESEDGTVFELVGQNLGILIGKHGQTLDSLQYLANLAANRGIDGNRHHIILDVENYRARREETLKTLAVHLAEKACRIHRDVRLEPMNRHERKIIHTALQDSKRVTTRSEGDEPRRYVVITPRRSQRRDSAE